MNAQEYYSNPIIQKAILDVSKDREIAGRYESGAFGKRPNALVYPNDLMTLIKEGCVEFHASVEHWISPMSLSNGNEEIYKELRSGWDFVIDIDGKKFEYSKIAARLILKLLESHGIKNYGVKFSGRRGFHICVPWNAFPKQINKEDTAKLYPALPRILARYIREEIRDELLQKLTDLEGLGSLTSQLEKIPETLDPFEFVEVEKDWGSRHMFRAPYSLHKATMLVALPIRAHEIENFDPLSADPSKISEIVPFIVNCDENEAEMLVIEALDWNSQFEKAEKKERPKQEIKHSSRRIEIEHFPPSIKKISDGLSDGKKRALFVLLSFLTHCKWSWEEIENYINQWNEKNPIKLPANYITSQIRWFERQARPILPPNYETGIYESLGVLSDEERSGNYKSPLVYAYKLSKPKTEYKPQTNTKPKKKVKEEETLLPFEDMSD